MYRKAFSSLIQPFFCLWIENGEKKNVYSYTQSTQNSNEMYVINWNLTYRETERDKEREEWLSFNKLLITMGLPSTNSITWHEKIHVFVLPTDQLLFFSSQQHHASINHKAFNSKATVLWALGTEQKSRLRHDIQSFYPKIPQIVTRLEQWAVERIEVHNFAQYRNGRCHFAMYIFLSLQYIPIQMKLFVRLIPN